LEVAKDRARIDAEIARCLRPVAVVPFERLEHVFSLKLLLRLLEWHDRRLRPCAEIEVFQGEQRLIAEDERLLDAVLELPDVTRPRVFLDGPERPRTEAAHWTAQLIGVLGE